MNTKILSQQAADMVNQYKNFHIGSAVCAIPYFNNKTTGERMGIRARNGKGSPKDIFDEIEEFAVKEKIDIKSYTGEALKKFLADNRIGIDCSGFAYYILNEESKSRGKGSLDRHLSFPVVGGIVRKLVAKFRPVENAGVKTFAHDKNSKKIGIQEAQVGDIITMIRNVETVSVAEKQRDHILVISQIEYQNFQPVTLHYVHSIAWPSDGEYGHGIHEGKIDIIDINKNITEQRWIENEKTGEENYTHMAAKNSATELRRLSWF